MKILDKILCVDNTGLEHCLTLNKYYDIIFYRENKKEYKILNDVGVTNFYYARRFLTIKQIRKIKIENLFENAEI